MGCGKRVWQEEQSTKKKPAEEKRQEHGCEKRVFQEEQLHCFVDFREVFVECTLRRMALCKSNLSRMSPRNARAVGKQKACGSVWSVD